MSSPCRMLPNARLLAALCVGLYLALGAGLARADALDGVLEVQSAFVNVDDGVFKLHARVQYPGTDRISAALRDGATLEFDVDAVVSRTRRLWFDANVVAVTLRRELTFHTVSNRYLVREARSGAQESFATLEEALARLGSVEEWPILVEPQVADDARYRVSVRAGVRRGRLSDALRVILFWSSDWHRTSEWYSWSLPS